MGCAGNSETGFTVSLPEVDTSAMANDLKIRVYGRGNNLLGASFATDLATVSVSGPDGDFTLYPELWLDAAGGTPGTT